MEEKVGKSKVWFDYNHSVFRYDSCLNNNQSWLLFALKIKRETMIIIMCNFGGDYFVWSTEFIFAYEMVDRKD